MLSHRGSTPLHSNMVSTRQKGFRTVASGKKILQDAGWTSCNLEKSGRFIQDKDCFGLWDYLFIRGKEHLFIQFKTNKHGSAWKKPYFDWGKEHGSGSVRYEIWNKIDYEGFVILGCK